jgi:putative transposase
MKEWRSLAHIKWECKYYVVIVPKYRKKVLYGRLIKRMGEIMRELMPVQIRRNTGSALDVLSYTCVYISTAEVYSIAMTIGYLKGKSAIRIHKELLSRREPKGFTNKNFWTRGYCVSTAGLDEKQI